MNKRSKSITFRVSLEELASIRERAGETKASDYVRRAAMGVKIEKKLVAKYQLLPQDRRMFYGGLNNLNQIVMLCHVANKTSRLDAEIVDRINDMIEVSAFYAP